MGRGKLKMELIRNEKARRTTFHKRVKGLKKKMYEFSTLLDVKACLIIYGPKQGDKDNMVEPETWPENQNHVSDILRQFLKYDLKERGKREVGIEEFFKSQTEKLPAELDGLQRQNDQTKYPPWDQRLDNFSLDQLETLSDQLDLKLQLVKQKLDLTEGELELDFLEEAIGYFSASPDDLQQLPLSDLQQQPLSDLQQQPLSDYYIPTNIQQMPCFVNSHPYAMGSIAAAASSRDNCSMLPSLDQEFEFNNSSQAAGYYVPGNIHQMPFFFLYPQSYAMGHHHHLNEF